MHKIEPFFFDIKTVGLYPDFDAFKKNDLYGSSLFEKKYNNSKWKNEYCDVNECYLNISQLQPHYGKIFCMTCGIYANNKLAIKTISNDNEYEVIKEISKILYKIDKSNYILVGFMIKQFDIPWIINKFLKYEFKLPDMLNIITNKWNNPRIFDLNDVFKINGIMTHNFKELCYGLDILNDSKINMFDYNIHDKYWSGDLNTIVNDNKKYIKCVSLLFDKIIKCL